MCAGAGVGDGGGGVDINVEVTSHRVGINIGPVTFPVVVLFPAALTLVTHCRPASLSSFPTPLPTASQNNPSSTPRKSIPTRAKAVAQ